MMSYWTIVLVELYNVQINLHKENKSLGETIPKLYPNEVILRATND